MTRLMGHICRPELDIRPRNADYNSAQVPNLRFGAHPTVCPTSRAPPVMLPKLQAAPNFPDRLTGVVPFAGRTVALSIQPDGSSSEAVMNLASSAVDVLGQLDSLARQVAARRLLTEYNSSWREFIRVGPDGQDIAVSEPELGESDFMSRLKLTSVEAAGDSCLTLGYDDDHMFAGHSVFVTSFHGVQFADAHAELFG